MSEFLKRQILLVLSLAFGALLVWTTILFMFPSFWNYFVERTVYTGRVRSLQVSWALLVCFCLHDHGFFYKVWRDWDITPSGMGHHPWAGVRELSPCPIALLHEGTDICQGCTPALVYDLEEAHWASTSLLLLFNHSAVSDTTFQSHGLSIGLKITIP